jgi:multidrug efflux system membrane fusion protein
MNRSLAIAAVVALAAAGWILSGQIGRDDRPARADMAAEQAAPPPQAVRVRRVEPRPWQRQIIARGRTEATRSVKIRAETAGRIVRIGADKGQTVKAGALIVEIDAADRPAQLAEARALLKQREMEYEAARSLSRKGFRAETQLAASAAELDAARARIARIETDIARTRIGAPFDGALDTRAVELGNYVQEGDDVATVVDLDPVLVVGSVTEREVSALAVGAPATAALVTGEKLEGRIRYIASVADPATRTFRFEVEIPNPRHTVRHGVTSEIRLPLSETMAHFVAPSTLTLDDDGRIGVKIVTAENRVRFVPVEFLADTPEGIWIGGLDGAVTVIAVGQGYVRDGERVRPVAESVEQAS